MLVELSVMEQRYQAVLAVVQDGWKVTTRRATWRIDAVTSWAGRRGWS